MNPDKYSSSNFRNFPISGFTNFSHGRQTVRSSRGRRALFTIPFKIICDKRCNLTWRRRCYKTMLFGGILGYPKRWINWKKVCFDIWTCSKMWKQSTIIKLFIAFKMAYSGCFHLGEELDFLHFSQKKFYSIDISVARDKEFFKLKFHVSNFVENISLIMS